MFGNKKEKEAQETPGTFALMKSITSMLSGKNPTELLKIGLQPIREFVDYLHRTNETEIRKGIDTPVTVFLKDKEGKTIVLTGAMAVDYTLKLSKKATMDTALMKYLDEKAKAGDE